MKANPSTPASSRGTRLARLRNSPALTASSCRTCPKVNERKNVPSVEGARTPVNSLPMPPCRSTPRSSMLSAPANIPATTAVALTAGHGAGTLKRRPSKSSRPVCSASRRTGTRPAAEIRFGSSKTAETLCDACTCEMPFVTPRTGPSDSPILLHHKGISASRHAKPANLIGGSRLSGRLRFLAPIIFRLVLVDQHAAGPLRTVKEELKAFVVPG